MVQTIYDLCTPRSDVLKGALTEADFAADIIELQLPVVPMGYDNGRSLIDS